MVSVHILFIWLLHDQVTLNGDLPQAVEAVEAAPGISRRQELRSPWPGLRQGSQLEAVRELGVQKSLMATELL